MKTNNRTCVITQSAIQYLLLLAFAFSATGAMVWFCWTFVIRFLS